MAADKEVIGLSRVHIYTILSITCPHKTLVYSVLAYRYINNTIMHPIRNLLRTLMVLWENEYFLTSNPLGPFTSVKSCPLVNLPALILRKKYYNQYFHNHLITSETLLIDIPLIFVFRVSSVVNPHSVSRCNFVNYRTST